MVGDLFGPRLATAASTVAGHRTILLGEYENYRFLKNSLTRNVACETPPSAQMQIS
jgi:hypothetical protein